MRVGSRPGNFPHETFFFSLVTNSTAKLTFFLKSKILVTHIQILKQTNKQTYITQLSYKRKLHNARASAINMPKSSPSSPTNQPTNQPFRNTQRLGFFSKKKDFWTQKKSNLSQRTMVKIYVVLRPLSYWNRVPLYTAVSCMQSVPYSRTSNFLLVSWVKRFKFKDGIAYPVLHILSMIRLEKSHGL